MLLAVVAVQWTLWSMQKYLLSSLHLFSAFIMSLILTLSILYTLACGRPNRQHITGLTYPLTNLKARKHCTTKYGANVPHGSSNCWHQSSVLWLVACVDDCIACWPSAKFFFCLSTSTFIAGNISIIIP